MKVMLIDDELPILDMLKRVLNLANHECITFQHSPDALKAYPGGGFDVVISDFKMPEMNGIELLCAIRTINPVANVIILTGFADIENAIAAVNNGAYAFFRKPIVLKELIDTLKKIEDDANSAREKEVDVTWLKAEYSKLKEAMESLREVVDKMSEERREDVV
jgi:two-component system, NtrC family, response regulator HydG